MQSPTRPLVLFLALILFIVAPARGETTFKPYTRPVITWVPPYQTARSESRLRGGPTTPPVNPGPADVLTHVAFQFWVPTKEGPVHRVTHYDRLTDELIAGWRDWCHARGIRALLCVYNGEEKWDWPLARAAFADNAEKFVSSLVTEMEFHQLDGIDIDLEGNGDFAADRPVFVAFLQRLSTELRARQKQLFVDTFAYKWNAPNQMWWPDLFPLVDGLSSMGYEETGSHSEGWRGYQSQVAAGGPHARKLLIGLPTHLEKWQENTAIEHLAWFLTPPADGSGVALWDAQFQGNLWRTSDSWEFLLKVRGGGK